MKLHVFATKHKTNTNYIRLSNTDECLDFRVDPIHRIILAHAFKIKF